MTEQVSEQVFQAFKDEILRAIEALGGRISELSGRIDAYTQIAQNQDRTLAIHETQLKELSSLKDKVEEHGKEIVEIKTEHKTSQRNLITIFSCITVILTIISICIALFK